MAASLLRRAGAAPPARAAAVRRGGGGGLLVYLPPDATVRDAEVAAAAATGRVLGEGVRLSVEGVLECDDVRKVAEGEGDDDQCVQIGVCIAGARLDEDLASSRYKGKTWIMRKRGRWGCLAAKPADPRLFDGIAKGGPRPHVTLVQHCLQ
eukprot:gene22584-12826_t